jgi:hypothetical protein
MMSGDVEGLKREFPENYWQLVSNSILTGKQFAELIIYCPYLTELIEIKTDLETGELTYDGNINDVAWINWCEDEELPFLVEGKYYKNLYSLKWEVSQEDKEALTSRVKKAIELIEK